MGKKEYAGEKTLYNTIAADSTSHSPWGYRVLTIQLWPSLPAWPSTARSILATAGSGCYLYVLWDFIHQILVGCPSNTNHWQCFPGNPLQLTSTGNFQAYIAAHGWGTVRVPLMATCFDGWDQNVILDQKVVMAISITMPSRVNSHLQVLICTKDP